MRLILSLLLFAFWIHPAQAQAVVTEDHYSGQIDALLDELSEITGLEQKRPVEHTTISRDELKSFLEHKVREEIKPEEIRVEELLLKKLGFVPEDFDLKGTMIDLYTEQAAAFYDFKKQKMFMLESGSSSMEDLALAHELAHALADQHFNLEKFLDEAGKNDDGALARMAVMEGQATWLMSEIMARKMGQSLITSSEMVGLMSRMMGAQAGRFPVFDQAPIYIRESLLFPYTLGLTFQQAVIERYGKQAFTRVFKQPPRSTREIMHPETYFEDEPRRRPKLPQLRHRGGYEKIAEGCLGEFDYAVLVRQYVDEDAVRRIAPTWRAGRYRLLERKDGDGRVLMHVSVWDTPEAALDFFGAYQKVLNGKWKSCMIEEQSGKRITGSGDDGVFELRLTGSSVYAVEGLHSLADIRRWPQP